MKTGCLYVDGFDVYREFGLYVTDGGWNELVAYPPLKPVKTNDWQEEDGVEADLSAPVLNTREVNIKFAVTVLSGMFDFLDILSDGAYHTFSCDEIKRVYRLRLTQQPNMKAAKILGLATLKFADDFPLDGYSYIAPESGMAYDGSYTVDGLPFTNYGGRIIKGTYDEIVKSAGVKPNLLRNISVLPGASYDGNGSVTYKSKDVKLQCLLRAESLDNLWRNYDALLYDLVRPGERLLGVDVLKQEFPFYYKSCQVTKFEPTGRIWLQFSLTLTFTRDFRIGENMLLSTEDGQVVFTQDEIRAIDLQSDSSQF